MSSFAHTLRVINVIKTQVKSLTPEFYLNLTYRNKFIIIQEASANRQQRLLRPFVEPVDAGAVDYGREFTATHTQGGADGREAKYNLGGEKKQSYIHYFVMILIECIIFKPRISQIKCIKPDT